MSTEHFDFVTAGLVPAIHADGQRGGQPWMPGPSLGMTRVGGGRATSF